MLSKIKSPLIIIVIVALGLWVLSSFFRNTTNRYSLPNFSKKSTDNKKDAAVTKVNQSEINSFAILQGAETKYLDQAQEKAREWSSDSYLVRFYVSVLEPDDVSPYISYTFYSPSKDKLYDITWYSSGRKEGKEKDAISEEKLAMFPPSILAQEAVAMAKKVFGKNIYGYSAYIRGKNDYWWISLHVKPDPDTTSQYRYIVYFDSRVDEVSHD